MTEVTQEIEGLVVLTWGLVYMSVCVPDDWGIGKIEHVANMENPTGISSGWALSDDGTFADGPPNPCACGQLPDRKHYLLNC